MQGDRHEHVIAFGRQLGDDWAIVIAPRVTMHLTDTELWPSEGWETTEVELPEGTPTEWVDQLTGGQRHWEGRIPLDEVFSETPVGLLATNDEPEDRNHQ